MSLIKSLLKAVIPASVRKSMRENQKRKAHEGGAHECCYCGATVKTWAERGIKSDVIERLDIVPTGYRFVSCPFCQSYDRDRQLFLFLKAKTDLFSAPTKLLHIAPELTLEKKLKAASNIDYLSGDLDGELAMEAMDVTNLRFEDDTFDAVICNHVMEHVPGDSQAMKELLRVLKPGGWAILQVPIGVKLDKTIEDFNLKTDEERLEKFGQIDHVRVYSQDDYVNRLQAAGWSVEIIDFIAELGPQAVAKFGLHPREKMMLCHKPGSI